MSVICLDFQRLLQFGSVVSAVLWFFEKWRYQSLCRNLSKVMVLL